MSTQTYYDEYWTEDGFSPPSNMGPYLRELYGRVIAPGAEVLDFGCGDGSTSGRWLVDHGARYTGVDVSATGVERARRSGLEAVCVEDTTSLPFDGDRFDAAVSIEVLEHLFAPHEAVAEVHRILKPGGTFVATTPNTAYWRRRAELLVLGSFSPMGDDLSRSQPWRDPHIRFFTASSLRSMLERAGFVDVGIEGLEGTLFAPGIEDHEKAGGAGRRLYHRVEQRLPSVFGRRLCAVARKPG